MSSIDRNDYELNEFLRQSPIVHDSVYQHNALLPQPTCVRLLTIHSPTSIESNSTSPLSGSLSNADLDQKPMFNALSYVWGIKDDTSPFIMLDGKRLRVTENCYQALLHLRHRLGTFTIWVDAICINQTNPEEQIQQVGLMQQIYSQADDVFVWLGPGTHSTARAISCLSAIAYPQYPSVHESQYRTLSRYLNQLWHRLLTTSRLIVWRHRLFYARLLLRSTSHLTTISKPLLMCHQSTAAQLTDQSSLASIGSNKFTM